METVFCPECEAALDVPDDVMQGEIMECAECGAELEVMSVQPLVIELAPEVEEDWGE